MAFSNFLRRTTALLSPVAIRAMRNHGNFHSALCSPLKSGGGGGGKWAASLIQHHFSSLAQKPSSDKKLIQVVESEIICAEESDDRDRVEEIPDRFPFEIQDNPGEQTITLRREYNGETIKVEVHMPDLVSGENDNDNDDDDGHEEKGGQSSIPLIISVSKGDGTSLEFSCTAYPDDVSIDSMSVREPASEDQIAYEGPDFSDLDENLQKAFHKYLEIRGIKPSTTNFLQEYMINKDSREYLMWLKNLKKFIEK